MSEPRRPTGGRGFSAELVPQEDPEIGREVIRICHDDGRAEEFQLHDYERLYSLPGVYEEIVQERLGCRSPAQIASMLAAAVERGGWGRGDVRVLDLAAGNGVSGQALAAEGLRSVLGIDIVTAARTAALRDRPGLYENYLTLDLVALTAAEESTVRGLGANAVSCVAPVGEDSQQLPPQALAAAAGMLAPDAFVATCTTPAAARRMR